MNKNYVIYKPCKKPIIGTGMLSYFEDEIGYYFKSGILELETDE